MARAGPAPAGESTVRTHSPAIAPLIVAGVLLAGLALPAAATEPSWGDAPEPGLHRLLRDLVREAREHPPCAQGGRVEPRLRARGAAVGGGVRQGPRRAAPASERCAARPSTQRRQAGHEARPPS